MEPLKSYIDYLNNNLNLNTPNKIGLMNSTDSGKYKIITNTNAIKNTILQTFFEKTNVCYKHLLGIFVIEILDINEIRKYNSSVEMFKVFSKFYLENTRKDIEYYITLYKENNSEFLEVYPPTTLINANIIDIASANYGNTELKLIRDNKFLYYK